MHLQRLLTSLSENLQTKSRQGKDLSELEVIFDGLKQYHHIGVGWDFHFDEPASDRPADFKVESDNAGRLRLHNENGQTTSWLSRGVSRGAENDRYAGRLEL